MKVKEIDHISFAVKRLDEARRFYEEVLGLEPAYSYESSEESIRVIRYYVGAVAVEIMEPTTPTCEVARFLEKSGEGFFLISYRVDDVAKSLDELRSSGQPTIDRAPRSLPGIRYAFIQPPKLAHGILTEIIEGELTVTGSQR